VYLQLTRCVYVGTKLKGLAEAAENYHVVLAENRKLYNEVQDLKGKYYTVLIFSGCELLSPCLIDNLIYFFFLF